MPWGGALLALEPAQEELHPDIDQVIVCGLAAQIGIAQDPIDSLSPNATTGKRFSSSHHLHSLLSHQEQTERLGALTPNDSSPMHLRKDARDVGIFPAANTCCWSTVAVPVVYSIAAII